MIEAAATFAVVLLALTAAHAVTLWARDRWGGKGDQ